MAITSFPRIPPDMGDPKLVNHLNMLIDEMEHTINGHIDSKNVREIAGFMVNLLTLMHKSGIVGLSAEDPANPNAVRFWAGDAVKEDAPFRVLQKGLMIAVGALLMSASGFPRVEMNGENLIKAMASEDDYMSINPTIGGSPALAFTLGGVLHAYLIATELGTILASFESNLSLQSSENIDLRPGNALMINGTSGYTGNVAYVAGLQPIEGGGTAPYYGYMNFTKGILTSVTGV